MAEYTYTKYPVNVEQLVDEIISSMNLVLSKISIENTVDGNISYSDAIFENNLKVIVNFELSVEQEAILDGAISGHTPSSDYNVLDWSRRRDVLKPLFYAEAGMSLENFAGLSTNKKLRACEFFFIPYNVRTMIISDSQDAKNWEALLRKTKESRITCIEAMRIKTGEYIRRGLLTLAQSQAFYRDVVSYVQWFNDSNSPDLKQWITNEVGSEYENSGFEQKSYYLEQLEIDLMDIYNGNY